LPPARPFFPKLARARSRPKTGRTAFFLFVLVATFAIAGWWLGSAPVSAHAELVRSNPPADGILTAPPSTIQLWTSEAVATGAGSPDIRVLDESGKALPVSDLHVDPADAQHIVASVSNVGYGTFTVLWTTRSDVDGHTLSGTFAFRVGGTSRAPGAATVEGQTPRLWAVATRWLTFLGAAIAAAGFLIGPLVLASTSGEENSRARRMRLTLMAALVGIVATLLEPLLQTKFPPSGAVTPSFGDAIHGLPTAWWLRAPGLAAAAGIALLLLLSGSRRFGNGPLVWIGVAAGLVAILGLALTSHASARESWRAAAIASVIIHQWSVGLWTGGLVQLLAVRPFTKSEGRPLPIQRFSFWALFLAGAGIVTGVINAGLIFPTLASLWKSDYGRALIVKVLILVPTLLLATFHRVTLRRALARAATAFRLSLRLETALVVLVVLAGSTLAMLAPPTVAKGDAVDVDLASPLTANGSPDDNRYVLFHIDPAKQGTNSLGVQVTDGPPLYLDAASQLTHSTHRTDIALVRISFTNLEQGTAPVVIDLPVDGTTGWFRATTNQLGLGGWWRADVLVRRLGVEDVTVPFFLILPDPNVNGFSSVHNPASSPDAKGVFDRGLSALTSLSSVHFTELLNGGIGTVSLSQQTTHAASGDQPASMQISTKDSEVVRIGGFQWFRDTGQDWSKTDAPPVVPPAEWGSDYLAATSFQLGPTDTVEGRSAQIVMFYVPGTTYASAWYAWWVDAQSGDLLQEAMVSRGHYMRRRFDQFNSAPPIVAPAN
jgi:putative copper export protein/methionine-rich copper-binding protein CopC